MNNLPNFKNENGWVDLEKIKLYLAELHAETDRQMQETDRYLKEKFAETDKIVKETALSIKETDRQMQETDRKMQETDRIVKENALQMKELKERLGGMANSHGSVAEEYFFNSFEKGEQNFFGERFDEIEKNVVGIKKGYRDEYDILLINGKSIGIIEVKYKAHENDVRNVLKKAATFRINFPEYQQHQVYLGLASMAFYPTLEQECINEGIAIIKQLGDTVVICDEHLKVF